MSLAASGQSLSSSRKTDFSQDTHATELCDRFTPPRLPLHSGNQVSSLRRIEWHDQSAVAILRCSPNRIAAFVVMDFQTCARIDPSIVCRRPAYQDIPRPIPSAVHLDTSPGSRTLAFRSARTGDSFAQSFWKIICLGESVVLVSSRSSKMKPFLNVRLFRNSPK
jgi:hypothetical protein